MLEPPPEKYKNSSTLGSIEKSWKTFDERPISNLSHSIFETISVNIFP